MLTVLMQEHAFWYLNFGGLFCWCSMIVSVICGQNTSNTYTVNLCCRVWSCVHMGVREWRTVGNGSWCSQAEQTCHAGNGWQNLSSCMRLLSHYVGNRYVEINSILRWETHAQCALMGCSMWEGHEHPPHALVNSGVEVAVIVVNSA